MATICNLSQGAIFATDFQVDKLIATGGQGSVYRVVQLSTDKPRALKILHHNLSRHKRAQAQFLEEARVTAKIYSDHIAEVVAAGLDAATGLPWLAMEFLDGKTIEELIAIRPLPRNVIREIFRHINHALSLAHEIGLVHRDLKPSNIFLAKTRHFGVKFTVKILDFGIAKVVRQTARRATYSGTPHWMAPEQFLRGEITPAADVWALGLIAFRLLVGKEYWRSAQEGAEESRLYTILEEMGAEKHESAVLRAAALQPKVKLPAGFDEWFAKCLNKDISERYQNSSNALSEFDELFALDEIKP